jgi:hypothetical protein
VINTLEILEALRSVRTTDLFKDGLRWLRPLVGTEDEIIDAEIKREAVLAWICYNVSTIPSRDHDIYLMNIIQYAKTWDLFHGLTGYPLALRKMAMYELALLGERGTFNQRFNDLIVELDSLIYAYCSGFSPKARPLSSVVRNDLAYGLGGVVHGALGVAVENLMLQYSERITQASKEINARVSTRLHSAEEETKV